MKSRLTNFVEKNGWVRGVSPPIFFCFGTRCIFFTIFWLKELFWCILFEMKKTTELIPFLGMVRSMMCKIKGILCEIQHGVNGMSINRLLLKKLAHWPMFFFLYWKKTSIWIKKCIYEKKLITLKITSQLP